MIQWLLKGYINKTLIPQLRVEIKKEIDAERVVQWKEKCDHLFSHEPHDYYKFKSSGDIPLNRLEKIQDHVLMLEKKLTSSEFDTLMDILEGSIDNSINASQLENKLTGLKNAMWAIKEIRSRKTDLMFHPFIMAELAAYTIIRDDEDPYDEKGINMKIHDEKVELFKTEGGTIPFLCRAGLGLYLPNSEQLISAVQKSWEAHKEVVKREEIIYNNILGEVRSTSDSKTSEKVS